MSLDHDAIRARADAATEGPWYRDSTTDANGSNYTENVTRNSWDVAMCPGGDALLEARRAQAAKDADFIAHARTDVPALLDENARLRAALYAVKITDGAIEAAFSTAVNAFRWEMAKHGMPPSLHPTILSMRAALEAAAQVLNQVAAE